MSELEFGSDAWIDDVLEEAHKYESDLPLYDVAFQLKRQRDELRAQCEKIRDLKARDVAAYIDQTVPLWLQHAIVMLHDMVDLTNHNDPIGKALTRVGLERRREPYDPLPMSDPRATKMWCVLRSNSVEQRALQAGDLVCVEVPRNCTVHSADAERLARMTSLAEQIGDLHRSGHRLDPQLPADRALLDELARWTEISSHRNADGSEDVKVRR